MRVTDKNLYMEPKLVNKFDLMIKRFEKKMDNMLLIDGDEGLGKTNIAVGACYYFAYKTKRPFSIDNIFFDLDELIKFAKSTNKQIILWDEGALGGLSLEWWKKNQIDFMKLLMISRKKGHLFIINIPKFFKLNEYLVVDRSIGLIHVYARGELERGRFVYFSKKKKEKLFYNWKKNKQRNYKKYVSFRGTFSEYLPKVIDEKLYDAKKDEAIMNFDKKDENDSRLDQRNKILFMLKNETGLSLREMSKYLEEHDVLISYGHLGDIFKDFTEKKEPPILP